MAHRLEEVRHAVGQGLTMGRLGLSYLASGCPLSVRHGLGPRSPELSKRLLNTTPMGEVRVCDLGFSQLDATDSNRRLSRIVRNLALHSIVVTYGL